jgi:pimeloyl-ACP methyl ester carboxylesterase
MSARAEHRNLRSLLPGLSCRLSRRFVETDGCRIHVVEAGEGPAVILCHGFPELWLSWRHQLPALVEAGYRVVALDMRGHGLSSVPEDMEAYSVLHTVSDVIAVMDAMGLAQAVLVGHDAGTTTVYHTALMRPDRVAGVVGLSVPYIPRGPTNFIAMMRAALPPEFYMLYFQQRGIAERDLERAPGETLRRLFFANSGEYAGAPITMMTRDGSLVANLPAPEGPMGFISEGDLEFYAQSYTESGFSGGLNGYRVFDLNWRLTGAWTGMALPVPSIYIGGNEDTVLQFPGFRAAAEKMSGIFLDEAGHWVHAERPNEVNQALLSFLARTV